MINQFYIDYIKAIENPDRIGWNGKVWTAPQYKGYDKNQRGYGIDIVKNDSAKRLTQNRPGQWLTEGEADKLMKEHLLYVYGAAQKHIEGFDNLSDRRKAALLGMLYRGDSVNKNRHIIDINEPDDNKFFESISNYYKSKGLNERAKNSSNFFSNQTNFLIPMKWEQWEPPMKFKSGGQVRKMQTAAGGPILLELNWDAHDWLSKRVDKPVGLKYTPRDVEIFNSHIPEYQQIEKEAKANGTWLKMPDGSTWKGDPRAWVMMQSKAYKKNYSSTPWYTGLAAWPTKYDYGNGVVETNKLTRAPYYNGQMWFSNNKNYGDVFAHAIDSLGKGNRYLIDSEKNIKGKNFLTAIPKIGNFRFLEAPPQDTYDHWFGLPYRRTSTSIERVKKNSEEFADRDNQNLYFPKAREGDWETTYKTDDIVNWSKDLGDLGIFMNKIYDGPNKVSKDSEGNYRMYGDPSLENSIDEFISQPGFTNKVKFIEGNNGDFDINNPYKYAYNFSKLNDRNLYAKQGGKMNILEFLKNGSGIHIKEKNKGSFTRWCGGNVTEECIRRGKNSSNPKIRKKATFADNARHFKHKEGGIIKASDGTKTNFFLKSGNWINNNKDLVSSVANVGLGIVNNIKLNKVIDAQIEANEKLMEVNKQKAFMDNYIKALGMLSDRSDIVNRNKAWLIANNLNYSDDELENENLLLKQSKIGILDSLGGLSTDILNAFSNNKKDTSNNPPSDSYFGNYVKTLFKNPGTFNSDGSFNTSLGAYKFENGKYLKVNTNPLSNLKFNI